MPGTTPSYDADGNLTALSGQATFWWNALNQLSSWTDPTNNQTIVDFTYDGEGRMVSLFGVETPDTTLIYDGDLLLGQVSPGMDPSAAYTCRTVLPSRPN